MFNTAEEFREQLIKALNEAVSADSTIKKFVANDAVRTNQNTAIAVMPKFEIGNMAPVIYVEPFFEDFKNGTSIDNIVSSITEIAHRAYETNNQFDLRQVNSENAQIAVTLKAINALSNEKVAESCAHLTLNDLIAVPVWSIKMPDGSTGNFLINKSIQTEQLRMTDSELLKIATKNALDSGKFSIRGMSEVLKESFGMSADDAMLAEMFPSDEPEMMYVLSHVDKSEAFGAVGIFSTEVLKSAEDVIKEKEFFVIPSSIHETLIIPASRVDDPARLQDMCMTVNETEVAANEVLSSNIYFFDGEKLSICNTISELEKIREANHEKMAEGIKAAVGGMRV